MKQQGDRLRDLCLKLANDAERWIAELRLHGIRRTVGHGMMLKCTAHVEQIIRTCGIVFLRLTGDEGLSILKEIQFSACVDKLTLGQQIRFLKAIIPLLRGKGLLNEVNDQTWSQLNTVRRMRNEFMHAKVVREDVVLWTAYLEASRAVCQTGLVHMAIEAEEREPHR
jgi:hypothetical protein